jgi:small GTP-binding protein
MDINNSLVFVMIGRSMVGKSSLLSNFSTYYKDSYTPTRGCDIFNNIIYIGDDKIRLQVIDTGGVSMFQSYSYYPEYKSYRRAHGIVAVYDITDKESFNILMAWIKQIKIHSNHEIIIVGNKSDLSDLREVTYDQGKQLANSFNCIFLETSAKNYKNVEQVFHSLSIKIMSKIHTAF